MSMSYKVIPLTRWQENSWRHSFAVSSDDSAVAGSCTVVKLPQRWISPRFLRTWPEIPDHAGYSAIWPPNTQRKCMVEIKQNKIEQVLFTGKKCRDAVELLKVSSAILISCFSWTNVTGPAFHRCLFSKLGSHNALYYRGLKSSICIQNRFWSAIADNMIGISQFPRSLEEKHRMMYYLTNFHLRCWFHRPANCVQKQFRVAQISSTKRERLVCVDRRTTSHIFRQKQLAFLAHSAMFGIKIFSEKQAF